MCGICGKVNLNQPVSKTVIEKINNRLFHRGPDFGNVLKINNNVIFGHRRLSIIDLSSNANQPMQDKSNRYTIVYNGEVYNYKEIKNELIKYGYIFNSTSDTEVVLNSYIHWGIKCFRKFNGMFALAIWDQKEKTLVFARDKFGKKPLFYTLMNGELSFSSELGALLEDKTINNNVKVSISSLNQYLALGYILDPKTIYHDIYKLEPSTYMVYKNNKIIEKTRYWEYKEFFHPSLKTKENESEIIEHLRFVLEESISYRLRSDVPVGAFLSGGIDSSGVAAITKKIIPYSLETFTLKFEEESYNESTDAKIVSDYLNVVHHEIILGSDIDSSLINKYINMYGEPFSDTSLIPMAEVSKLASKYVKVVLSGDGADEVFGGYLTYKADSILKKVNIIPLNLRKIIAKIIKHVSIETNKKLSLGFKLRQFSKGMTRDYQFGHYSWRELFSLDERINLIGLKHKEEIMESDPFNVFKKYYDEVPDLDELSQHLYVDAKTWLANDILVKVDRATMAYSLESRSPYLDSKLVEYAATIPSNLKYNNNSGKYILKKVLEKYLPAQTLNKKKSGFNAPVNVWLNNTRGNEFRFFNKYVLEQMGLTN